MSTIDGEKFKNKTILYSNFSAIFTVMATAFNRTLQELKYKRLLQITNKTNSFNRTLQELK